VIFDEISDNFPVAKNGLLFPFWKNPDGGFVVWGKSLNER